MPYFQMPSPSYHVCGVRDCEKQEEEWGEKSSVLCVFSVCVFYFLFF